MQDGECCTVRKISTSMFLNPYLILRHK